MYSSTGRSRAISALRLTGVEQAHGEATTRNSGWAVMETPLPSPIAVSVEPNAQHVGQVRRIAAAWLRNMCRMPESRIEAVLVVVSELVTNAVLYGNGHSVGYRSWSPEPGLIRFEIDDGTESEDPLPQAPSPTAESGRGLLLVSLFVKELGGSWGFIQDGTTAWCCLPIHDDGLAVSGRREL
ncbi:ATP-binding protein [Streptomyces sp. NPDC056002]|uniref:ATP-binding protein n=1 Tax=Streptomyces sp. NPDC056002 TaxID=3345675 RepID=UPI0035DA4A8F